MLEGQGIRLRTVRANDLESLIQRWGDLRARGDYFPHTVLTETELRRRFQDNGFWHDNGGWLIIETPEGRMVGTILFFLPNPFYHYYEIGYIVFAAEDRGHGYTSEAVRLLAGYLFNNKRVNKLLLSLDPDNDGSRRVAEKNGFSLEGVDREGVFIRGGFRDMQRYSLLRREWEARTAA